jgi:hypothetical protein
MSSLGLAEHACLEPKHARLKSMTSRLKQVPFMHGIFGRYRPMAYLKITNGVITAHTMVNSTVIAWLKKRKR